MQCSRKLNISREVSESNSGCIHHGSEEVHEQHFQAEKVSSC